MLKTLSDIFEWHSGHGSGAVFRAITRALFPIRCLACGSFFHPSETPAADGGLINSFAEKGFPETAVNMFSCGITQFVCPDCLKGIVPVGAPLCRVCGVVFPGGEGPDHTCQHCIEFPKYYGLARAAGVYDQTLMELIHSLKYKGKIQLAEPLGLLLFSAFIRFWGYDGVDMVIPVPLHPKRFRNRGFNQAYLMIRRWPSYAEALGMDLSRLDIRTDVLVRNRWTDPQTSLDRRQRMRNIANAFDVTADVEGKAVVLVDDVYTTGATGNECSRQLMRSGARQVDILTLARTL